MRISLFLCLMFTLSQAISADRDDLLSAGSNSSWGDDIGSSAGRISSSSLSSPVSTSTSEAQAACTKKEQTSIPYKSFLNLLASKDVSINRDAYAGTLELNGGMMVGNCNSMLEYNFYQPDGDRPYMFQVAVKRPAGCDGDKCQYSASLAQDRVATGETLDVEVEPTYYGFIECLRKTGALDGNKFVKSKIAPVEFSHRENNVYSSGELWFYSNGPEGALQGGVYSKKNLKNEGSCKYFEDIADGGFSIQSKDQVERNRMLVLYDEVCSKGSYLEIEQRLPDFAEFTLMYSALKNVRDARIGQEIMELHSEMSRNKDFSNFDVDKYQRVIKDFYEKIITPKRIKMEKLVTDLSRTNSKSDRAAIEAEIKEITKELLKLNKSPYITIDDYKKMRSFKPKSPLHEDAWREAALLVFKSNNIAHHYSRFDPKVRAQRKLENLSIREVRELVVIDSEKQEEKLDQLGLLASDTTASFVDSFKEKTVAAQKSAQIFNQESQYMIQEEQQYMQNKCFNPQYYWIVNNPITQRNCVMRSQEEISYIQQDTAYFNEGIGYAIQDYSQQISMWAPIEAERNAAYGVTNAGNTRTNGRTNRQGQMTREQYEMAMRNPQFSQQFQQYNPNQAATSTYFDVNGGNQGYQQGFQQRSPAQQFQFNTVPASMQQFQYNNSAQGQFQFNNQFQQRF